MRNEIENWYYTVGHPLGTGATLDEVADYGGDMLMLVHGLIEQLDKMDCGNHTCHFGGKDKKGQRLNSTCSCLLHIPGGVRIGLIKLYAKYREKAPNTDFNLTPPTESQVKS